MVPHMPYIWVVGHHRSGDIWIATETKAGHDKMVDTVDVWLPKLSDRLHYVQKTYPVIIHRSLLNSLCLQVRMGKISRPSL